MTRRRKWTVEDTWECSSCKVQNRGHDLACTSCGNPKDKSEKYKRGDVTKAVTDAAQLIEAHAGPNWSCPYCRFDNRALVSICSKCGAPQDGKEAPREPLSKEEANQKFREMVARGGDGQLDTGALAGTFSPFPPSEDPYEELHHDANGRQPQKLLWVLGALLALALLIFLVWLLVPHEHDASVSSLHWEYTRVLRQRYTREDSGWGTPSGAFNSTCTRRQHGTENCNPYQCRPHDVDCNCHEHCDPVECDPPNENGYRECHQDCDDICATCTEYDTCYAQCPVYDDWCTYSYYEWTSVDTETTSGSDHNVSWGTRLHLSPGLTQEIVQSESYSVTFAWKDKHVPYLTADLNDFNRFEIGANWDVETNYAGMIRPLHLEPSR